MNVQISFEQKYVSDFSHYRHDIKLVVPFSSLLFLSPCLILHRHQRPVEKQPGKNAQLWKRVEIFARVARRLTVSSQIWCQGARQPQQIKPSLTHLSSSLFIVNSRHQTRHDLTVITPSENQRRRPQTQTSWNPQFPEVIVVVVNFPTEEL